MSKEFIALINAATKLGEMIQPNARYYDKATREFVVEKVSEILRSINEALSPDKEQASHGRSCLIQDLNTLDHMASYLSLPNLGKSASQIRTSLTEAGITGLERMGEQPTILEYGDVVSSNQGKEYQM